MSNKPNEHDDFDQPDFLKGYDEAEKQAEAAKKGYVTADETDNEDEAPKESNNTADEKTQQERSEKATTSLITNQAMEVFLQSASNLFNLTSLVDSSEARRLVFVALNKAEIVLQDNGITWKHIYQSKFVAALANAALLGLDAELDEVYVIPYKEKSGRYTMNLQRSYKGERKLRMLHSIGNEDDPIIWIDAHLVRKGDTFKVTHTEETDKYIFEEGNAFSDEPIIGAFGYIKYKSGRIKVHKMSLADLEKRAEASRNKMGGKESPAWKNWRNEMYLAKMISAVCKLIPVEFKDKTLQDAYKNTDYEMIEAEVLDNKDKIQLNPGSVD